MRTLVCLLVCGCTGFQPGATPPDYTPSLLAAGLVLPVALAVNDRHVYFLEFGPQNQGLEGTLSRVDKQAGCAQADAGCRDLLADMRFLVVSLALAPDDACWLEFYDNMRELWCLQLSTARL